jgi:hypothetical protein
MEKADDAGYLDVVPVHKGRGVMGREGAGSASSGGIGKGKGDLPPPPLPLPLPRPSFFFPHFLTVAVPAEAQGGDEEGTKGPPRRG